MTMRARDLVSATAAAVWLAACVTVNIYFPAPQVQHAAEQIVDETWGGPAGGSPAATPPAHSDGTSWRDRFGAGTAWAQEADINVSTAAIRALKDAMHSRAEQLKPFLAGGNVGLGGDGLLVVRTLDGVALRDQASIRRLVEAENRDRLSLYREIATANKFGADRIPDIQRIFAATWIAKAEPGWWVQQPDGGWQRR